ncbi:unnamed protein product [Moneuplotes crassus]|uniref:histidine kinase n=1 Tax=Euplotes crassus TaxID=5936 RepID=A0AAD1Y5M1_EUPCR|nr:unnamed protein product [Moneuplotes crassus]
MVDFTRELDGSQLLEFRVKDTGSGIKQEDQSKFFKLFGMLEDTNKVNPNRCGLGLTVSKKYIELLGGSITVDSVYGEGTEMFFTIASREIKQTQENNQLHLLNMSQADLRAAPILHYSDYRVNDEHSIGEDTINKCNLFTNNESKF